MDIEISEVGKPQSKLVLTSSGLTLYVKSMLGVGAYYSVNNVTISEGRNFVEHTMPGRKGSVFQDMGRPAIKINIEGNISEDGIYLGLTSKGGKNKIMLEELHKLCDSGKPVDFICDMPTLFGVSRVVIQELEATEVKGRKHNYDYKLTLKEWTESAGTLDKMKFLNSLKSDAKKQLVKKGVIFGAAAAVTGTYIGVTSIKKAESLVLKVQASKSVVTAEESVEIKVSVNDSKGNPIADADVTITQGGSKQLFSGKSNAEGAAVATFQSPDAGNYEIKASATKSGFEKGESSGSITVDNQLKTKLTTDRATIKASGTPNTANLKVTTTDCNGKAVDGVTISMTCTPSSGTLTQGSTTTDAQGVSTATLSSTTAGTYEITVKASKSPYAEGKANISIKVI